MNGDGILQKEVISIVVPCYNEEEMIPLYINEIEKTFSKMREVDYEYLF